MISQETLLQHAEVCSRSLKSARNPYQWLALWHLRELWKALAVDGRHQADIEEQVEILSEAEAQLLSTMTTQFFVGKPS
jgi:hypothetical protein